MADLRGATASHHPPPAPPTSTATSTAAGTAAGAPSPDVSADTAADRATDRATNRATDRAAAADAGTIEELASAIQAVVGVLKQSRLHDFLLASAGVDLDRAGIALLHVLFESSGHLRIGDLAERLHVDAPSVSRTAARLERAGLVGRSADDEDRRACRLHLTPAGRGALDSVLGARRAWLAAALADWSPAERAAFARALHRFADGVDRHLEGHDAWKR